MEVQEVKHVRRTLSPVNEMLTPCGPMLFSLKLLVEKSFAC